MTEEPSLQWFFPQMRCGARAVTFCHSDTVVDSFAYLLPVADPKILKGGGRFRHYIQTTAAVFHFTSSGRSAGSSLYSRQAGVSGFGCHRLERSASPRRIFAVTRGFQTTTRDLSVFPFLPRHYHMTRVLLSPFITTV